MAHSPKSALGASPGPRVRSPHRSAPRPSSLSEQFLSGPECTAHEAAARLLLEIEEEWRGLQPWSLHRSDPVRRLVRIVPALVIAPFLLLVFGAPLWAPALAAGLGLFGTTVVMRGNARRIAVTAAELSDGIEQGVSLEALEPTLARLLLLDPDHDGARLLLAARHLEESKPLDALLQLAPLRDRHPDCGEVVVLAALAYARIGAPGDAARMLDALRPDPRHPWFGRLHRFAEVCRRSAGDFARASSDQDPAEL